MTGRLAVLIASLLLMTSCSSGAASDAVDPPSDDPAAADAADDPDGSGSTDGDVDEAPGSSGDGSDATAATTDPTASDGGGSTTASSRPGPTDTPDPSSSTDVAAEWDPDPIEWEALNESVDAGAVEVPVDYDDPDGPTIELYIARRTADDPDNRIGSLIVNPGGPGFGGSDFALRSAELFDRALLERFDIVGFDPRGTGLSEPAIDCVDDLDPYVTGDATPEDEAEAEAIAETAREFAEACMRNSGEIIEHVGTNNAARDIDSIRRALGEEQISYFGFSYGSELGATWATLFPDTVRAAVLDGAADPNADSLESSKQQLAGFEASLSTFLERCSEDERCAFHNGGDAGGAFDELVAELDEAPIVVTGDRPPVNQTVALSAASQAMYSDGFWPFFEEALASAQRGDGSGLLLLHDAYYQRREDGTFGDELEAFQAIRCADSVERPTRDDLETASAELTAIGPRLNPEGSLGFFCSFFPAALDPWIDVTGAGAGPIAVIGTTGDPATPFESTVRMSNALEDGRLVIVEADQHTGYGVNRCVVEVVNRYLVDLDAPADETKCA